jgi:uncharacterized membrane protein YtjA (UPF0391 family)
MWTWLLAVAIVVILAAVLGFTSLAATSAVLAKTLFLICLAAFLAVIVKGVSRHA